MVTSCGLPFAHFGNHVLHYCPSAAVILRVFSFMSLIVSLIDTCDCPRVVFVELRFFQVFSRRIISADITNMKFICISKTLS